MDELDKVEQVREKTQASYEDAKAALDAHDGNRSEEHTSELQSR
mgnify:CR=1 FL=1